MKVRRVDFFPDEYLSGVQSKLTAAEQGVYWFICARIYSEGGPIDRDDGYVARACILRADQATRIIDRLLATGKLRLDGAKLSSKRCLDVLKSTSSRIEEARLNGSKGGRPRKNSEENQQKEKAEGLNPEKLTTNQQPATNNLFALDETSKPPSKRVRTLEAVTVDAEAKALADEAHVDPQTELARFKDWCRAKGRTFRDYRAAYHNWLRKAPDFAPARRTEPKGPKPMSVQQYAAEQDAEWERLNRLHGGGT
jgi:uncharacterized protein YdaU (DUF1376 family)